jgi:hypothetical protein
MIAGGRTLLYDLNIAYDAGERRNPLRVMRALGIQWTRCDAEPIDQQIRFERCTSIPVPMPVYLRIPSTEADARRGKSQNLHQNDYQCSKRIG